ncbi:aldo/keto reductase [Starkeya sp. ORNL1]|uniref:aldo/keto reductase n=1 Tax=Starkeya sp. ORNL1 TaxID=2709380 RepID=UPI001FEFB88C|nr:aldo/keto reductase [Starkeya sp. ORNL1]
MSDGQKQIEPGMNRRDLMAGLGAGLAAVAAAPGGALAQQAATGTPAGAPNVRPLPRGGELPLIGLGTFLTFDLLPGRPRDHLREVVKTYWDGGARVIDTSPLYGTAEYTVGVSAAELGITDQVFLSDKIWSTGEFVADESHAARSLEQTQGRLWRERIDVMHCHSLTNVDAVLPILRAWKKEGRIRYVGVTHHENDYHVPLTSWIERGGVDFIQVNYSIFNRAAENRVLPAAQERGVAVLVNMPLEKARLHKAVEGHPLPDFAREIGAESWAQFFLKWVISNPAVNCALPSTSNPAHARENIGALRGPLPDAAMRRRMVQHMETIPAFSRIAQMPWYPDKTYEGVIRRAQAQMRARS